MATRKKKRSGRKSTVKSTPRKAKANRRIVSKRTARRGRYAKK